MTAEDRRWLMRAFGIAFAITCALSFLPDVISFI